MSERYKTYEDGLFFTTLTVVGWIDVFTRKDYALEILVNLNYCINHKGLKVYAYCLMSNHLHLIASVEDGLLSNVLRHFKSYTSKKIIDLIMQHPQESRREWLLYMFEFFSKANKHNTKYQFWQPNNHPVDLLSPQFLQQKVDYIHNNPVEAGIVDEPHHYLYSSAHPFNMVKLAAF